MPNEFSQNESLKEELVRSAVSFCRSITSFALLEDITELQGMCFSPNELLTAGEQDLIVTCQLILHKLESFRKDLIEYGVEESSITSFSNQVNHFKTIVVKTSIIC